MTVTRDLAHFIQTRAVDSAEAVEHAKRGFLDWLGVTIIGAQTPAALAVDRFASVEFAAGPASSLAARGRRLAPTGAALVNGTTSHALDYDDVGLGIGHPTAVIAPAALAVAELVDASGRNLIEAMVIGYEIAARFASLPPDSLAGPYQRGYHGTSIYGIFGATAAACRLMGLDDRRTAQALGIAASECAGLRVNFGTMTKPYHAGAAASAGVRAALLARDDFTACLSAIEDQFGWFDVIGRSGELPRIASGLGDPLAIEAGLWFKAYPCCGANHGAIDGLLEILDQHRLTDAEVARVEVEVHRRMLDDVLVYRWPTSGLQGKFCLAYNVVAALVDRRVTIATFDDAHVAKLTSHRARVAVRGVDGGDLRDTTVRVHTAAGDIIESTTTDGRRPRSGVRTLRGTESNPLSWQDLCQKFRQNTEHALAEEALDDLLIALTDLDRIDSTVPITQHLTPSTSEPTDPRP